MTAHALPAGPHSSRGPEFVEAGHTRITANAMSKAVTAVAAQALAVPVAAIKVSLDDDNGKLAASLTAPLAVPTLEELVSDPEVLASSGGSIFDRASEARRRISAGITAITGSDVGRVDIRISGVHHARKQVKLQ